MGTKVGVQIGAYSTSRNDSGFDQTGNSRDEERWSDPRSILKVELIRVIKYIKESINKREESRMKGLGSEQWEEWIFL